jgi:hypothetical protein
MLAAPKQDSRVEPLLFGLVSAGGL